MRKLVSIALFLFTGTMLSAQVQVDSVKAGAAKEVSNDANPGGQEAFLKYLRDSTQFPFAESLAKKQGTIYVCFTVEKDGSISEVRVVKAVPNAPGFSREAIRVISTMPKWTPGQIDGKVVRVTMTQPIKFVLQDNKKKKH